MSVPSIAGDLCEGLEAALVYCEAKLLAKGNSISSPLPVPSIMPGLLPGFEPEFPSQMHTLIACGVLLGVLVILHIARQAWYLWGGEGAYAFPFDK